MRWQIVIRLLTYPASAYVVLCLVIFLLQRSMMYSPSRISPDQALAAAKQQRLQPWRNAAGQLIGWKAPNPGAKARGRMLVFHGNAGMALDRAYLADAFHKGAEPVVPLDVYIFEYPGYGPRGGSPTQTHILETAMDALNQLKREDPAPVFLMGESLGTGFACLLAGERPREVAGIILVTPLNNMRAVAHAHFSWLPTFLVRDRLAADRALAHYAGPIGFVIAEQDEVIPARLGRALFEGYAGPKRLWVEAGATHNAINYDPHRTLWKEIMAFVHEAPATRTEIPSQIYLKF
jgi:uncharacterized protein